MTRSPANDDHQRHDENGDLLHTSQQGQSMTLSRLQKDGRVTYNRATNANSDGELHLVLHRHPNRSDVLRRVGDDRQQNETDEGLGDVVALGEFLN